MFSRLQFYTRALFISQCGRLILWLCTSPFVFLKLQQFRAVPATLEASDFTGSSFSRQGIALYLRSQSLLPPSIALARLGQVISSNDYFHVPLSHSHTQLRAPEFEIWVIPRQKIQHVRGIQPYDRRDRRVYST
jgi:hypothetical protein